MPKENNKFFLGVFTDEDDVKPAAQACNEADFTIHDVFAPYEVHGLDRAMGLGQSKITWITFLCAVAGGTIGLLGMSYVSWWDWPLNIGGKEPLPLPAFVPVMFELTVLIGGVCTMLGLFALCRLFPGKKARLFHPRVTDDRFVIALEVDEDFDETKCREIFAKHNAAEVKLVDHDYEADAADAEASAEGGVA